MKSTKNDQLVGQPLLFKSDLKFMDFWNVTDKYLAELSLGAEARKEAMTRIHDFSSHLNTTIQLYPIGNKNINQKIYNDIATGLKEAVRRAKISLAMNPKFGKVFADYWKHLSNVLKQDALLLKDEKLQNMLLAFEQNISTIK